MQLPVLLLRFPISATHDGMKHFWTSKTTFFCICALALIVLIAEYRRYMKGATSRLVLLYNHCNTSMTASDSSRHNDIFDDIMPL